MKKTLYISLTLLLISAISCKNNTEVEKVAEYFETKNAQNELIAKINFSLPDSTLLRNIEEQTKVDICDNSRFTAIMNFKGIEIKFPAFANKNCNWNTMPHNLIPIIINKENQVLVSYELVEKEESLENILIKATKEMINGTERKNLLYLFQWDKELKPDLTKKRIFETLKGIVNYSNKLSLIKFQKNISELTESEKELLKEEFTGIIGMNGYFPPPPPIMDLKTEMETTTE